MIKNLIVIPVRLESTRLPNKALLEVNGKTILQHTYEQCLKSKEAEHTLVITDNEEIMDEVSKFHGCGVKQCFKQISRCGTERFIRYLDFENNINCSDNYQNLEKVISVQVDYPQINPLLIDKVFESIEDPYSIVSALYFNNHSKTDDVCTYFNAKTNLCKSFSRLGDYSNTHIGIYGFTAKILKVLNLIYKADKSESYDLEQNLWLEYGLSIRGLVTVPTISINNQDDLDEFRK